MTFTPEMQEIIDYLQDKDNYACFGGLAAFLYTGIECSADIDVFVDSIENVKAIAKDFIDKGWKEIARKTDRDYYIIITVEKNNTTFDIYYSKLSSECFLPDKVELEQDGKKAWAINAEALLLTKINQLTSLKRTEEKTLRDRKVIHLLREKIEPQKVKDLLQKIPYVFWRERKF